MKFKDGKCYSKVIGKTYRDKVPKHCKIVTSKFKLKLYPS